MHKFFFLIVKTIYYEKSIYLILSKPKSDKFWGIRTIQKIYIHWWTKQYKDLWLIFQFVAYCIVLQSLTVLGKDHYQIGKNTKQVQHNFYFLISKNNACGMYVCIYYELLSMNRYIYEWESYRISISGKLESIMSLEKKVFVSLVVFNLNFPRTRPHHRFLTIKDIYKTCQDMTYTLWSTKSESRSQIPFPNIFTTATAHLPYASYVVQ